MIRMKKTIAILLAVLFLVTVTAGAVSATCPKIETKTLDQNKPVIIAIGHNIAGLEVAKDKNPLFYAANKGSDDTSQGTSMATSYFTIPYDYISKFGWN